MNAAIKVRRTRAVAVATAGIGSRPAAGAVTRQERLAGAREIAAIIREEILGDLDAVYKIVQAADDSTEAARRVYNATGDLLDKWHGLADDLHTATGLMFMPGHFTSGRFSEFEKIRIEVGLPLTWRRFWTGDRMLIEPEGVKDGRLEVA
jgi:hypothetical protein